MSDDEFRDLVRRMRVAQRRHDRWADNHDERRRLESQVDEALAGPALLFGPGPDAGPYGEGR